MVSIVEQQARYMEIILSINDDINENTYTALPTAVLSGRPDGNVMAPCTESMRLPLFHESIRQQLYNRELARNLTCPFKGRRRTCCGFGHRLQNI
jgi:hypothetical protein